ncbi:MAG: CHRD domain-containing protein [Haloarculaceae archaeon]
MLGPTSRRGVIRTIAGAGLVGAVGTAGGKPERGRRDADFVAPLTAGQSTKVKRSDGKGYARLFYDRDSGELTYRIDYEGELDITQIHIHHAEPQSVDNRLVVFLKRFNSETDGTGDGETVSPPATVTGSVNEPDGLETEDPEVPNDVDGIVGAIVADPGAFQINTHTTRSPGGEIRGQLRGPPIR